MEPKNFPNSKMTIAGAIAIDETKTEALNTYNCVPCGVEIPSEMTGTAISFEDSADNITFRPVIDPETGAAYSVSLVESGYIPLKMDYFWGCLYVKVVSNQAEAAARALGLRVRGS
jgi:hypothetical protein